MRRYIFILATVLSILIVSTPKLFAQNVINLTGTSINWVNSGNVKIVLDDYNIVNNASGNAFSGSGGAYIFKGSSEAYIDGTDSTTLYDVELAKTGLVGLTLNQDLIISNSLALENGFLDIAGKKLVMNGSTITRNSGQLKTDALNSKLVFGNSNVLTLPAGIFNSSIEDLTIRNNSVQAANDLTISGDLILTAGSLALGTNNLTIESDAVISRTNGVINLGTGDLIYKAASLNTANFSSITIDNIELNRTGGTIALTGNLAVTNGFTLTSGTFDIAGNTLSFNGSIAHTAGAIDADAGTVNFNNASPYTISNGLFAGAIYRLGANGGALTLSNPTTVSNLLSMGGANIISSDANVLAVGTSKTNTGSITWTTGTIVGPLKRWFEDATNSTGDTTTDRASGIFPVGMASLNRYAQINFTQPSGGGYLIVKYKTGKPLDAYSNFPLANNEANYRYIQNADTTGYWELTPYSENGTEYGALNDKYYKLKLRINTPGSIDQVGILNDPPSLRLVKAPGNHPDADGHGPWEPAGTFSGLQTINAGTDYVIESSNVKGFSWFNGGGNNENPLPVVLLSFTGNCENEQVTLNWSTASEHQSSYFEIEKSRNGNEWSVVKTMPAAGYSTQKLEYSYIDENSSNDYNYYRLTQVDENGKSETFNTIVVSCDVNTELFKTLPNPSTNSFQVLVNNKSLVGKATINMVDTKGTVVSKMNVEVVDGVNVFYLNEDVAPGIYYISISNGVNSTEVIKHSIR